MFKKNRHAGLSLLVIIFATLCLPIIIAAGIAQAHGVELEYVERNAIEVTARYDTEDPMAGAQVAVFAPDSPAEPWLTGTCDSAGRFFFVPDPEIPGLWEVQIRHAGHGGLLRIEVDESGISPAGTTGFTGPQKLLMTAAVIWGLVGTALYFSRRRS